MAKRKTEKNGGRKSTVDKGEELILLDLSSDEIGGTQSGLPVSWPQLDDTWSLCGERNSMETTEAETSGKPTRSIRNAVFNRPMVNGKEDTTERKNVVTDFLARAGTVMEIGASIFKIGQQQPARAYRDKGLLWFNQGTTRAGAKMVGCGIAMLSDDDLADCVFNAMCVQADVSEKETEFLKSIGVDHRAIATKTEAKKGKSAEFVRDKKELARAVAELRSIYGTEDELDTTLEAIVMDYVPTLDPGYLSNVFQDKHKLDWGRWFAGFASAKARRNSGLPNWTAIAEEAKSKGFKSTKTTSSVALYVREALGVVIAIKNKSADDCKIGEVSSDTIAAFKASGYTKPSWNSIRLQAGIKVMTDDKGKEGTGPALMECFSANKLNEALDQYKKEDGDKGQIVSVFNSPKGFTADQLVVVGKSILTTKEAKRERAANKPK